MFVCLLAVVITGCNREEEYAPLESDVIFKIYEAYTPRNNSLDFTYTDTVVGEPFVALHLETEKWGYSCSHYIKTDVQIEEDSAVTVTIHGITADYYCPYRIIEQAEYDTLLDLPNGDYDLYFIYQEQEDHYLLTVTDSSIDYRGGHLGYY